LKTASLAFIGHPLGMNQQSSLFLPFGCIRNQIYKLRKRRREKKKMNKLNWSMRACGVILLWATAAVGLPAQTEPVAPTVTFTSLYTFCQQTDCTDGSTRGAGWSRGRMAISME
jgi:hypothetical protein